MNPFRRSDYTSNQTSEYVLIYACDVCVFPPFFSFVFCQCLQQYVYFSLHVSLSYSFFSKYRTATTPTRSSLSLPGYYVISVCVIYVLLCPSSHPSADICSFFENCSAAFLFVYCFGSLFSYSTFLHPIVYITNHMSVIV